MHAKDRPKVSVLIPVRNAEPYLTACLQSITRQTFANIEILAVDDGSTDNSAGALASWSAKEPRLRAWSRTGKGLISTRNELLACARGSLIAWMDADDVALPTRIELQVDAFSDDPSLVCVGTYARQVDPDGEDLDVETYPLTHEDIVREQAYGGGMRFATTMALRQAAVDAGGFREPFRMGEDFDFLIRLSERGRLANLPVVTYLYRQHLASVCATLGGDWTRYRDAIIDLARERKHGGQDRLQRGEAMVISGLGAPAPANAQAAVLAYWSQAARRNGNFRLAMRYGLASLRSRPMHAAGWRALMTLLPTAASRLLHLKA